MTKFISRHPYAQDTSKPDILSDSPLMQAILATLINGIVDSNGVTRKTIALGEKLKCKSLQGKHVSFNFAFTALLMISLLIMSRPSSAMPSHMPEPAPAACEYAIQPSPTTPTEREPWELYPIEALSPYQNNWTIKPAFLRSLTSRLGRTLVLYPKLKEGKVYDDSNARAKKIFLDLNNDYELSLEEVTESHEVTDVPTVEYNFVPSKN
ncbi:hypothetical protein GALMADRAFT_135149 [Galerina marginata CBS 339.88]|uniref:Uncharacterized protein n=1 Tax=Galerina marginata (strain CBS 339.88) TaxID=685588 RepID=A0A067TP95_GALM3|nr:hypothetical protein GALMADRAFT_135149 [Galerina marginata CBS 339.88]